MRHGRFVTSIGALDVGSANRLSTAIPSNSRTLRVITGTGPLRIYLAITYCCFDRGMASLVLCLRTLALETPSANIQRLQALSHWTGLTSQHDLSTAVS